MFKFILVFLIGATIARILGWNLGFESTGLVIGCWTRIPFALHVGSMYQCPIVYSRILISVPLQEQCACESSMAIEICFLLQNVNVTSVVVVSCQFVQELTFERYIYNDVTNLLILERKYSMTSMFHLWIESSMQLKLFFHSHWNCTRCTVCKYCSNDHHIDDCVDRRPLHQFIEDLLKFKRKFERINPTMIQQRLTILNHCHRCTTMVNLGQPCSTMTSRWLFMIKICLTMFNYDQSIMVKIYPQG